jgi:hypothetical protein
MPTVPLSRVGVRVVESGPGGQDFAPGTWRRLEELPGPRSPQGRIYSLACLIAIAICPFAAAGNDRFAAVGQWIRRAGQARLCAWDPITGRYRAPDEKTIRVVPDRLDPRALARALLDGRPSGGGPSPASVRGYRARQAEAGDGLVEGQPAAGCLGWTRSRSYWSMRICQGAPG